MPRRLSRTARIRAESRFKEIFELKASAGDPRLIVYAAPFNGVRPRLGVVVGKRHGTAVRRNRKKRLLREAFRLAQRELPAGYDYVLLPRTGPIATLADYSRSLNELAPKAVARVRIAR